MGNAAYHDGPNGVRRRMNPIIEYMDGWPGAVRKRSIITASDNKDHAMPFGSVVKRRANL